MVMDTIFNNNMRVVFANEPEVVRRRLNAPHPEDWVHVCVGETQKIVTVPEYLYQEKYDFVVGSLKDLVSKKDAPMYRRDPSRFEAYIQRAAVKLIEQIQK